MAVAYFNGDGRCLAVGSGDNINPYPGTVYSVELPGYPNPSHIYLDVASGEVMQKGDHPITVSRNLITGIPDGAEVRVSGRAPVIVDGGEFSFSDEPEGNKWVRLTHPLYIDWAGNVPVGP